MAGSSLTGGISKLVELFGFSPALCVLVQEAARMIISKARSFAKIARRKAATLLLEVDALGEAHNRLHKLILCRLLSTSVATLLLRISVPNLPRSRFDPESLLCHHLGFGFLRLVYAIEGFLLAPPSFSSTDNASESKSMMRFRRPRTINTSLLPRLLFKSLPRLVWPTTGDEVAVAMNVTAGPRYGLVKTGPFFLLNRSLPSSVSIKKV